MGGSTFGTSGPGSDDWCMWLGVLALSGGSESAFQAILCWVQCVMAPSLSWSWLALITTQFLALKPSLITTSKRVCQPRQPPWICPKPPGELTYPLGSRSSSVEVPRLYLSSIVSACYIGFISITTFITLHCTAPYVVSLLTEQIDSYLREGLLPCPHPPVI